MSVMHPLPPRPLPSWLVALASLFVTFHLLAILALALSAASGPWPTPFGPSQAEGPAFASRIANVTNVYYLRFLQMTHNYHFLGNRPDNTDIAFDVRLTDADGHLIQTLHYPSPKDNAWLRQREMLLAQGLGEDEPVQAPRGEAIPAPGQKVPTMRIWDMTGPNRLTLRDVEAHLIAKDRPIARPREWSLILARSYLRYLSRQSGAASAELTRLSRPAIMPAVLFLPETPPGTFDTLASTFEEYHREK